jgi:glycogen debranching enzyme
MRKKSSKNYPPQLPDVWGEGILFASSGYDERTDWSTPYVGTLLENRIGFTLRTEREKTIWFAVRNLESIGENIKGGGEKSFTVFKPEIVAGDIISLACGIKKTNIDLLTLPVTQNQFLFTISPRTTSENSFLLCTVRIEACKKLYYDGKNFVIVTDLDRTVIQLNRKDFTHAVVDSAGEVLRIASGKAKKRALRWDGDKEVRYVVLTIPMRKGNDIVVSLSSRTRKLKDRQSIQKLKKKRISFYTKRITDYREKTLSKALSILKVNVESPQGVFTQHWTTPDRWPHKHLWLWDSCFHSLAYVLVDKKLAEDSILSVLDTQQENGFIPHIGRPNRDFSTITQPPLLSWAAYCIYTHTQNKSFLRKCYPRLRTYLFWCLTHRDRNKNRLLEWRRSDESGMDNSSRFNEGRAFDAIDFSSIIANDLLCLHEISRIIGKDDRRLLKRAETVSEGIKRYLWNRRDKFFYDKFLSGNLSSCKTVCGFLPLFSKTATENQADNLILHLTNEKEFFTRLPIPSESVDSPTFDNNMWRGPVWLNYNYFIIIGLRNYGYFELAELIRKYTIREVEKWYRKEGTIFEFYDPFAKLTPRKIPRKDTFGAIKEFGWSAAIYAILKTRLYEQ